MLKIKFNLDHNFISNNSPGQLKIKYNVCQGYQIR